MRRRVGVRDADVLRELLDAVDDEPMREEDRREEALVLRRQRKMIDRKRSVIGNEPESGAGGSKVGERMRATKGRGGPLRRHRRTHIGSDRGGRGAVTPTTPGSGDKPPSPGSAELEAADIVHARVPSESGRYDGERRGEISSRRQAAPLKPSATRTPAKPASPPAFASPAPSACPLSAASSLRNFFLLHHHHTSIYLQPSFLYQSQCRNIIQANNA